MLATTTSGAKEGAKANPSLDGSRIHLINTWRRAHECSQAKLQETKVFEAGTAGQDRRAHPRAEIKIAVSCERVGEPPLDGVTKDLGIGGTFIETAELLPFGTHVVIVGRLPGTTTELRLPGIVRWQKADGIGVQFGALGPRETHAILTVVGTSALPGKAHRAA